MIVLSLVSRIFNLLVFSGIEEDLTFSSAGIMQLPKLTAWQGVVIKDVIPNSRQVIRLTLAIGPIRITSKSSNLPLDRNLRAISIESTVATL